MKKLLLAVLASVVIIPSAYADDLLHVYQQALENDPVILAAKATRNANEEGWDQSIANLLPNISGTVQTTSVHTSARAESAIANGGKGDDESFNQHDYSLQLTQPLFNFQYWMQVRQASDASKSAQATYNAALQNLIVRVATAYFNVLNAEDTLTYTQAQEASVAKQLQQTKDRYQVGLGTMTDVYQAQAQYDGLVANVLAAKNSVTNNMEALRQITGRTYASLAPLVKEVPLLTPDPDNVEDWITVGEKNNWTLLASRYTMLADKENIRVNFAGHFPSVNAVGSYTNGNDVGVATTDKTQWESQVGVQVSIPLFAGGMVMSQTRQAQDNYVAAAENMESSRRQVVLQAEQAYNNVMSDISQIQADKLAVTSALSALDSTQAGYKAGTKTMLDVLTAEQNVYQAKSSLASDLYNYINSTIALKQASGSLAGTDVVEINHWLDDQPVQAIPQADTTIQPIPKEYKHQKIIKHRKAEKHLMKRKTRKVRKPHETARS